MAQLSKRTVPSYNWFDGFQEECKFEKPSLETEENQDEEYYSLDPQVNSGEEYHSLQSEVKTFPACEVKNNSNLSVPQPSTSEYCQPTLLGEQLRKDLPKSKEYSRTYKKSDEELSINKTNVLLFDVDNKTDMVTDIGKELGHEKIDIFILYSEGFNVRKLDSILPCIPTPVTIACGKEKNSADFVLLCKTVELHNQYPPETQFVIISGDRAFEEILGFLQNRPVNVVSPHHRINYQYNANAIFAPGDIVIESAKLQQLTRIKEDSFDHTKLIFVYSSMEVENLHEQVLGKDGNKIYPLLFCKYSTQRGEHLPLKPIQIFETKNDHKDSVVFVELLFAAILHYELPKSMSFEIMSPYKAVEEIKPYFKDREVEITEIVYSDPNPVKRIREKRKRKGKRPN